MLNILIPMAGDGSRFTKKGYEDPKPLIPVNGTYMVDLVLSNITPSTNSKTTLVTKESHKIGDKFKDRDYNIIELKESTGGALDTILRCKNYLDLGKPLLLANCDQLIRFDVNDFIKIRPGVDGSIVTFTSCSPHHSYVTIRDGNFIKSIVEKEVISNNAVAGVCYFKNCGDFIQAAEEILERDIKAKGEFYVSSAIDLMVRNGSTFTCYDAKSIMLGTPEELEDFLKYE